MGLLGKWIESLDYQFEILPTCTRHKSPRSTCQRCFDVCKEAAISIDHNIPVISPKKCIECGKCMAACPVQAVAGIFPKRTVVNNTLVMTSADFPTVKELLLLYKNGVRGIISENPERLEDGKEVVDLANSMLEQLGEEPFTVSTDPFEKAEKVYSRRELFFVWHQESQSLMKQAVPAKWRFNHTQLDLAKYYPDFQFATLSVDTKKCTLCKTCEFLCEKNCLTISETGLTINAQSCSACQLCVDSCPEQAITIEEKISQVFDVHYPIYQKRCPVCGQPYATLREDDQKCVACTKQEGFLSPVYV